MPVNHCFLQLKKQIAKKDKQLYSSLTGAEPAGEGPFRSREKDEKLPAPSICYGQSDPYGLTFPPTHGLPMRHKTKAPRHQGV
jgi:hypothetical protein